MAAVSQTATTLTPPSSSHGAGYSWHNEKPVREGKPLVGEESAFPPNRPSLSSLNGNSPLLNNTTSMDPLSRKHSSGETASDIKARSGDPNYIPPHFHKDLRPRGIKDNASPADSLLDLYDGQRDERPKDQLKRPANDSFGNVGNDDNSKWIHRDKLAKIESEELQAAGFFLPRPRERARSKSQNRTKRDQSQDGNTGHGRAIGGPEQPLTRSRKNSSTASSDPRTPEVASVAAWDLRLPDEIAEEGGDGYWVSSGGAKVSKIPVAKLSPLPIPNEHLERDTLLVRKQDSSPGEDDTINYPKPRARSGSTGNVLVRTSTNSQTTPQPKRLDASPKKPAAAGSRKPSAIRPANGSVGRPKTRGGPSKDSTSSGGGTTRPSTRSGERELSIGSSKQMEGEPPWMVSAYRPDPRLPPDQQLLPTVARRLQQEKWEREGKFGNVYDREFRPLTDEGFLKPPEADAAPEKDEEPEEREEHDEKNEKEERQGDWPLRAEAKSPVPSGRIGSYSTMPKIPDKATLSPLPSPRTPAPAPAPPPAPVVRIPEPPEEPPQKTKSGCGCCIVM